MTRRALISVTDKTGVVEFARGLVELGFSLLSTGGTYRVLDDASVPVQQVSDYTGFPEMMGGRLKTLHPRVHGGILAPRGDAEAATSMAEHGIDSIDVVAINLYRFTETAARPGATEAEVIENIDIGGPAMIRSAAKNHAHVTVVVDPVDYEVLLAALGSGDSDALAALRRALAVKAFRCTAAYDAAIARWFAGREYAAAALGNGLVVLGEKVRDLRYGENPHQAAAFYADASAAGPDLARAEQLSGKDLSYNNIVDLDAALGLVLEFEAPACAIIKHTNPCGTATAGDLADAFEAALESDPVSAFGSIVAFNGRVDAIVAQRIVAKDLFVEALIAPEISDEAVSVLQGGRGGKSVRLLSLGGLPARDEPLKLRQVRGGFLAQTPERARREPVALDAATQRTPDAGEEQALQFAWRVCKHVKSNAIVLARCTETGAFATVGVGAGQMSRVDAVQIAVRKAGDRSRGAVMASDAFFPFADNIEVAAAAGITAVVQPGGSRRDAEVVAAADAAGMAMMMTGTRHFLH